jgi:nitrite reductase (NADH) small subunit
MSMAAKLPAGFLPVCQLIAIPVLGSRVVRTAAGEIALFRTADDQVFALHDHCPHKAGPLSQGIVHGTTVTCPLHAWKIDLASGAALAPDSGCTPKFPVLVHDGMVHLALNPETSK